MQFLLRFHRNSRRLKPIASDHSVCCSTYFGMFVYREDTQKRLIVQNSLHVLLYSIFVWSHLFFAVLQFFFATFLSVWSHLRSLSDTYSSVCPHSCSKDVEEAAFSPGMAKSANGVPGTKPSKSLSLNSLEGLLSDDRESSIMLG